MSPELELLSQRALSAVLNGIYQGLLLTLVLATGLRLAPRLNAATRFSIRFAALLIIAALPLAHLASAWISSAPGEAPTAGKPSVLMAAKDPSRAPDLIAFEPARDDLGHSPPNAAAILSAILERARSQSAVAAERNRQLESPESSGRAFPPEGSFSPSAGASANASGLAHGMNADRGRDREATRDAGAATAAAPATTRAGLPGARRWRIPFPVEATLALAAIWAIVAGVRLVALARQFRELRRLRAQALAAPEWINDRAAKARAEMGIRRRATVGLHPELSTPIVAGLRSPLVLLPASLGDVAPKDLDPVLRHELAHIARRDPWTNLIQQCLRALYFFHPGVCWISRRLTVDREIACDDHALAALAAPRDYALLLTHFADRIHGRRWTAAPAAWTSNTQLKERIRMILDSQRDANPRQARGKVGILTTATAALAALAFHAAPRVSLASNPPENLATAGAVSISADAAERVAPSIAPGAKVKTAGQVHTLRAVSPAGTTVIVASPSTRDMEEPAISARPPNPPVAGVSRVLPSVGHVAAPNPPAWRAVQLAAADPVAVAGPAPAPEPPGSVESRLRRLERLVQSLLEIKGGKPADTEPRENESGRTSSKSQEQAIEFQLETEVEGAGGDVAKEIERAVTREIQSAMREAERASRQAQRAVEVRARLAERASKDGPAMRRQALDEQIRVLRKRLQDMEAQLERLEEQREAAGEAREAMEDARREIEDARREADAAKREVQKVRERATELRARAREEERGESDEKAAPGKRSEENPELQQF